MIQLCGVQDGKSENEWRGASESEVQVSLIKCFDERSYKNANELHVERGGNGNGRFEI